MLEMQQTSADGRFLMVAVVAGLRLIIRLGDIGLQRCNVVTCLSEISYGYQGER